MSLVLKNAMILEGDDAVSRDILLEGEKIEEVGNNLSGDEEVDLKGKLVMPGAIDVHVHFREPGAEHKEDWTSGSKSAAAGGVTTVLDMPNNNPPIVSQEDVENKKGLASKSLVNYGLYLGATKDNILDIASVKDVVGVKVYMGSSTGSLLLDSLPDFVKLLNHTDKLIVTHCENESLIRYFSEKNKESRMHHEMRDNLCAAISVAEASICANYYSKRLHIAHMSTKEEVDFLRKYKTDNITCEVCPHHLFLTSEYFCEHGNYGKMNPPLRSEEDREALWEAIDEGIVTCIATDHAPHTTEEKEKDFEHGPCGVPGVQTMLPLLLDAAQRKKLSLSRVQELTSRGPAEAFNLEGKGRIEKGYDADLVVVDLDEEREVKHDDQFSKCGWTPFNGQTLKGWPVMTFVLGRKAYDRGTFDESVRGKRI